MFVSYKWLSEYVDLGGMSAKELAEKITRSGIEVEEVKHLGEGIKNVVVGHVLEREPHPNADKLNKCLVDVGDEAPVQIICGAKNVDKGQKVAVAKVGAVLPGNFKIKKAKLRGEESHGMICSLQELGFESKIVAKEHAEGIFVFPNDVAPGEDALQQLNLDDKVLELGLTPNRSDCLSMLGVAYEVAAILGTNVKIPDIELNEGNEKTEDHIQVRIEAKEDNPVYMARIVKNVKIGPSPLWMQTRLMAAGIRPHNNVVDITNYILLEYGQPLHAFDYDRLGSKEIIVRRAREGETITTLDEVQRTLSADHLVITNGEEPVAIAGVMGGANSEVQADTTTVLIESAYFNGQRVRQASKDHGLRSEASARFEKGVDPNRVQVAADRCAQLMAEYAGGEVLSGLAVTGEMAAEAKTVTITLGRLNRNLGTKLERTEVEEIFRRLQFEVQTADDAFTVTVPTRRGDITIPEDLVEEVARLYGYDHLPTTIPSGETKPGKLTDYQLKRRVARRCLEGAGLHQAITYSLTSQAKATQYALDAREPIALAMPMSEEHAFLRQSLVPQLLDVISYNNARQIDSVALYEIGSVFLKEAYKELPAEEEHAAGAITGLWEEHLWQGEKKAVDFFVVKGVLEGLFARFGLENRIVFKKAEVAGMHPGRTAGIELDGQWIGFVGQVHPQQAKDLDIKETYVFELKLHLLLQADKEAIAYEPIPRFPSITRDIALAVNRDVEAGALQDVIQRAGGKLLKDVHVFDLYEGEHVETGKKSIAFSLTYFDPGKTLTDEEVVKVHNKVLEALKEETGAELRS
ncbi:phenylalanine--tRNA ligase subunit beta [Bacillus xiapuensis]|uniref:phenylalanine--tRNA ligase subunit beta n=1 Tax=Bacillus xiapuensis TaxID=2014075 RepID=UPI000C24583C|nr:phenylalanine--tRNA ligase subunit beta [Bacillus xiapuensis]